MTVDEQVTVGSIITALLTTKAEDVAKSIDGISQKPLLNALKEAGYKYSNKSPRGWHYVLDGTEPLDKSIFDFVKPGTKIIKNAVSKPITDSSPGVHAQFTSEEMRMIRQMLDTFADNTSPSESDLYTRIKNLDNGDKTRKTVVIDASIGDRFDNFCKSHKFDKSDVFHLALLDLMDKYE